MDRNAGGALSDKLTKALAGPALFPLSVIASAALSEAITSLMSLLFHGRVTADYLLTGLVASILVATLIIGVVRALESRMARLERDNRLQSSLIGELRRTEAELRIGAVAFESREAKFLLDDEGRVLRVNRAFSEVTGLEAPGLLGRSPRFLLDLSLDAGAPQGLAPIGEDSAGAWQGEIEVGGAGGRKFRAFLTIADILDEEGRRTHRVGSFYDLTERRAASEEIYRLSFFDTLTGLPNLRHLRDRLATALPSLGRGGQRAALVLLDIDGFRTINEASGPPAGDEVLREAARRMSSRLRETDAVSRISADEFGLILMGLGQGDLEAATHAETVVMGLLDSLASPYTVAGESFQRGWSAGATVFDGKNRGVDELLQQAAVALHESKVSRRGSLSFFDAGMQEDLARRIVLERELRDALDSSALALHFQPQVRADGRVVGAECLLRWIHPTRGLVPPGHFIPLAETTGLIVPVGKWVLRKACESLARWKGHPILGGLRLSINVSVAQFRQADFSRSVLEALRETGAGAERLRLEITESLFQEDVAEARAKMEELIGAGLSFSMDDFGTGYSSLSMLQGMPFGELKIDQSFVRGLDGRCLEGEEGCGNPSGLVRAIVAMGRSLRLEVLAEGVETEAQQSLLASLGCGFFQGYLFGKPMPEEAFLKALGAADTDTPSST